MALRTLRLLPELKERYPDLPSPASGEGETAKGALFEAIARTVVALSSRAPVVLFLDDLQWADATTLEVLDYAGKRWAEQGAPVLMLIAARPEEPEASSFFERWLPSLGRRLPVKCLSLGPLADDDVQRMLRRLRRPAQRRMASEAALEEPESSNEADPRLEYFGKWLAAESGGQPFYLVETLKTLLEEGKLLVRSRPGRGGVLECWPSLEGGERPKRTAAAERAGGDPLTPLSSLARGLRPVECRGGFGAGLRLRDVGGRGGVGGGRRPERTGQAGRAPPFSGGARWPREEGAALYLGVTYSFSHEKIRQVAYTEVGEARRRCCTAGLSRCSRRGAPLLPRS